MKMGEPEDVDAMLEEALDKIDDVSQPFFLDSRCCSVRSLSIAQNIQFPSPPGLFYKYCTALSL